MALWHRSEPSARVPSRRRGRLRAYARVPADFRAASDEPGDNLDSSVSVALLELSHEERNLILLLTWADLTYEQLADALDLPVGTIRSRISRVRSKLRERLTPIEASVRRAEKSSHDRTG